jgi:hypothetical protein
MFCYTERSRWTSQVYREALMMMLTWRTAGALWRSGRSRAAAPVELCTLRYGFLPARFRQHGVLHLVVRIEQIWEQRGRRSEADRRYFAVRCADMRRCTLVQELRAGTWQIIW